MADRYFVTSPVHGDRAVLTDAEAHHLARVMRAKPGDCVTLFDGSGAEFPAQIEQISRDRVELIVLGCESPSRELPLALTLGVSLPKGDRQRWLVEKAVELGVARIVPLVTARSVVTLKPQSLDRLRRAVVEASKQCGRNRLLQIAEPQSWADFLSSSQAAPCRLLAQPGGRPLAHVSFQSGPLLASSSALPTAHGPDIAAATSAGIWLAVGPEGGLSDEEVAAAVHAGWLPVDLGERILRIETAATLLVALVVCRLAGP